MNQLKVIKMHKNILITLLIVFTPIAFFEQQKHNKASEIDNEKFHSLNLIDKNNHQITNRLGELIIADLFDANKKNSVEIKYCWKEGDLVPQKGYCSSTSNLLHEF